MIYFFADIPQGTPLPYKGWERLPHKVARA